jgi:pimeloyl-ACP methyl ester carboxylesterase
LRPLFRASVQPYLISEFQQDPVDSLKTFDGPVLVVSGSTDLQVTEADGKRLAAVKPGTKLLVLDQMNHVLKVTDGKTVAEQEPMYVEPQFPLHPKLADDLAAFLKQSLGAK